MDKYATHLEALVAALMENDGPVLELGCGDYSTPVIAAVARAERRQFLVQASDESWARRYADLATYEIVDWNNWQPPKPDGGERWAVVLLDSEESTAGRIRHLQKLRGVSQVVLLHDANFARTRPHWDECIAGYDVKWYKRFDPHTAVLTPC